MDTVKRAAIHTLPKGEVAEKYFENATVHRYVMAEGKTLCGKTVPQADKRWVANRRGAEADINCARCVRRMKEEELGGAKPKARTSKPVKAGAASGPTIKGTVLQSKAAQRVARETGGFSPVPKPTTRKRIRKPKAVETGGVETFGEPLN